MSGKSLTTVENGQSNTSSDIAKALEVQQIGNNQSSADESCKDRIVGPSNGNDVVLPDLVLDKLYHSYSIKQRRAGLIWFLAASILFDLWSILVPQEQNKIASGISGVVLFLNAVLCILFKLANQSKALKLITKFAPHLAWVLAIIQLVTFLFNKQFVTPRDILGWGILINFLIYVTLPVQLIFTGIIFGVATFILYISSLIGLAQGDPLFWEQIIANIILIFTAAIIGLLYYVLGEAKQKRAFLEAKKSLEVKMIIEEQSAEQERLLLSVLPKHVAEKMRQDLGSTNSEQFKKIYMSRHENVSILYADIVGFTAISSTYSAQDLVKMLNELFARFDRLADKYQQLRIKILGDCYYCISGAPDEKPDHAVLCVHMGLSMVKAIKYVQQKTNSPVDMRVGIHTGAVLAGILGQRQWQFDVYSKDVELANKMESSGKAGRVHISEKTLSFLNGEFEVEPAFGEKREEALRIAGLKTYFIKKVLIPFVSPETKKNGGPSATEEVSSNNEIENIIDSKQTDEILPDDDSKINSEDGHMDDTKLKVDDFKKRLQNELVARDGHGDLSKDTTFFLSFKVKELEDSYAVHREPFSSVPLVAALLVQTINIIYSSFMIPRSSYHFVLIWLPAIIMLQVVLISIGESFPQIFPQLFVHFSKKFNNIIYFRRFAAIFTVGLLIFANLLDMYIIAEVFETANSTLNSTTVSTFKTPLNLETNNFTSYFEDSVIAMHSPAQIQIEEHLYIEINNINLYPSYLSNFGILILISIAVIAQLTHICKIGLLILFTALTSIFNIYILNNAYTFEDFLIANSGISTKYNVSAILFVAALSLSLLARHMDREDRVIFKWKSEVAEQKEKVTDMRRRNEALVYNVLPVHVAEHFMKNTKRSHDDLYSQSYAEVGVLFASMPNFSDFYSEETVNNQGLECLRFLNEVISDYDALLELPQFKDIIKIKTIGSTYMAASGINPSKEIKPNDPISVRWAHLDLLVQFALELKKALHGINEQSFNHFVLKMGINHGPITAGVIGARKPHYDIWGNTVNVASRMESTGKAGSIQVTEETCKILETFGYTFEQRGLVLVKGKGQLMTYYLQGKEPSRQKHQTHSSYLENITELPEIEIGGSKNILNLTINQMENVLPISSKSDFRTPRSLLNSNQNDEQEHLTNKITNIEEIEICKTINGNEKSETSISETDVEIEIIPLLNINSANFESQNFLNGNGSENDSLIVKE